MSRAFYSVNTESGEVKNDGNAPGFRGTPAAEPQSEQQPGGMKDVTYREGGARTIHEYKHGQFTSRVIEPKGAPTAPAATARDGELLSQATSLDSIITDKTGDRILVALAVQMGWVRATGNGSFEATEAGKAALLGFESAITPTAPKAGDEVATTNTNTTEQQAEPFDETMARPTEVQDFLSAAVQVVGVEAAQGLVNLYLDQNEDVAQIALDGMELAPEQKAKVAEVRSTILAQVDQVAISEGIASEAIDAAGEWARSTHPARYRQAMEQAIDGKTQGIRALAREFTEARVLGGEHGDGITVYQDKGAVMVLVPGQRLPLTLAAARALRRPDGEPLLRITEGG